MDVSTIEQNGATLVRLAGLMGATGPVEVRRALRRLEREDRRRVVLNVEQAREVGLGCLAMIVEWSQRLRAREGWLSVVGLSAEQRRQLERCGAPDPVAAYDNETDALEHLPGAGKLAEAHA